MLRRKFDKRRNVVPRWRPIEGTASTELKSLQRYPEFPAIGSGAFSGFVEQWRTDQSLEAASDLLDVGIVSGDASLSLEAARRIVARREKASARVVEAAERVLYTAGQPSVLTSHSSFENEDKRSLGERIKRFKRRVLEAPRDALAHVELSRCYSRLAEFEKAAHHMRVGVLLAPETRYVLRAASRFYTLVDEPATALAVLRSSSSIRDDPWVQSAEIAISDLFEKGSHTARRALRELRGTKRIDRSRSELALALATMEHNAGLKVREVLKILDAALVDPTENALAQGVWLTEQAGRDFQQRFPTVAFPEDAHEAMSLELDERGQLVRSEREGVLWLLDQPFQARAALQVADLNLVHLRDYKKAAKVASFGLELHHDDWSLVNAAALSETLSGQLDKANEHITLFEKLSSTDEMRAFSSAARGMWWFEKGNRDRGRQSYKKAIEFSRKAKRPDLVTNAVIFWLERESASGAVGSADFRSIEQPIENALKRAPADHRKYLRKVWDSRRHVIEAAAEKKTEPSSEEWGQLKLDFASTLATS